MAKRWLLAAWVACWTLSGMTVMAQQSPRGGNALRRPSSGAPRGSLSDRLRGFGRSLTGNESQGQAGAGGGGQPTGTFGGGNMPSAIEEMPQDASAVQAAPRAGSAPRSSRRTAQQGYSAPPPRANQRGSAESSGVGSAGTAGGNTPADDGETGSAGTGGGRASGGATSSSSAGHAGRSLQERIARGRYLTPEVREESGVDQGEDEPGPAAGDGEDVAQASEDAGSEPLEDGDSEREEDTPRMARAQPRPLAVGSASRSEPEADLLITRHSPVLGVETAGPRKIKVGEPARYLVTLKNSGQGAAQDVVVTVRIPEWADVKSSDPSRGHAEAPDSGDTVAGVRWHLDQLEAQAQETMALEIVPRKSRPFDLAVQLTHSPVTSQAMVEVQEAKLVMALSGPEEVFYGEQEIYKLTLSNPGTGDAENVVVRLLPTTPGETETASHRIGTIEAGHTKVIELELTARDPGRLMIQAEADAAGDLHASVSEEVLVRRADIELRMEGPRRVYAGTVATYRLHVANSGNAVAKNLELSLMLPAGAKHVSDDAGGRVEAGQSKVVWKLAQLRPEANQVITIRCRLEHPGQNHPQAICLADTEIKESASLNTDVQAMADLTLQVRDPQGPVQVGEDAVYELIVHNRGTKSAENVEVVAFFSEGIEPIAAEGEQHEMSAGQVVFAPVPQLAPGQSLELRVIARAQQAGNHVVRVQTRCDAIQTMLTQEESTLFFEADGADVSQSAYDGGNEAGEMVSSSSDDGSDVSSAASAGEAAGQPVAVEHGGGAGLDEELPADAPLDESSN